MAQDPVRFTLSGDEFVRAMLQDMAEVAKPVGQRLLVGVTLAQDLTCPIHVIGGQLGTEPSEVTYEGLSIRVPSLPEVVAVYNVLAEVRVGPPPLSQLALLVGGPPDDEMNVGNTAQFLGVVERLFAGFKALGDGDKPRAQELIGRTMAFGLLSQWLSESLLAMFSPGWLERVAQPKNPMSNLVITIASHYDPLRDEGLLLEMRTRARLQVEGMFKLLDRIRDDAGVIAAVGPGAQGEAARRPAPGTRIHSAHDRRVDLTRQVFYRALLCEGPNEPEGYFYDLGYTEEVYRARGVVASIYDCCWVGNAAYVFIRQRPGEPESQEWQALARKTRRDLIDLIEQAQPGAPVRVARFEHTAAGDSRIPLRAFLESL